MRKEGRLNDGLTARQDNLDSTARCLTIEIQCLSSSNLSGRHAAHHLLHHKYHISWFQCPISSQFAQAGRRAGACDSMQSKALDATCEMPVPSPHFWAIALHQCSLRWSGQTAQRLVTSLVLVCCFGCCAVIPLEQCSSVVQVRSHRWPRPSHDARRWMRKGRTDLIAYARPC